MLMAEGHRLLTLMPILRSQARSRGEPRDFEPPTEYLSIVIFTGSHFWSSIVIGLPLRPDASKYFSTLVDTQIAKSCPGPVGKKKGKGEKKSQIGKRIIRYCKQGNARLYKCQSSLDWMVQTYLLGFRLGR